MICGHVADKFTDLKPLLSLTLLYISVEIRIYIYERYFLVFYLVLLCTTTTIIKYCFQCMYVFLFFADLRILSKYPVFTGSLWCSFVRKGVSFFADFLKSIMKNFFFIYFNYHVIIFYIF